jgi:hypothetical protein
MKITEEYTRQVVKARDIMYFFGKKERQSFKMMAEMRKYFKKKKHQPITITNFCDYYGIKPSDFYIAMRATDNYSKQCSEQRKNATTIPVSSVNMIIKTHTPYQFTRKVE